MKKLYLIIAIVCSLVSANAQTSTDTNTNQSQFKATVMGFVDHVTTATNWNLHAAALYADSIPKNRLGMEVGADYLLYPGVYSSLTLAEVGGSAYGLSGQFSIKQQWDLFSKGKVIITTGEGVGAGTCLSGMQFGNIKIPGTPQDGDFFGVVRVDAAISFPTLKYMPTLFGGYQKWSNTSGNLWEFGLHMPLDKLINAL